MIADDKVRRQVTLTRAEYAASRVLADRELREWSQWVRSLVVLELVRQAGQDWERRFEVGERIFRR